MGSRRPAGLLGVADRPLTVAARGDQRPGEVEGRLDLARLFAVLGVVDRHGARSQRDGGGRVVIVTPK